MTTPAGWHSDPEGSGQLRWWDGQQWTSAVQPNPTGAILPVYGSQQFVSPQQFVAPQSSITRQPFVTPQQGRSGHKKWPWIVGIGVVVAFVGIGGVVNATDKSSNDASSVRATTSQLAAATTPPVTSRATVSAQAAPPPTVRLEPATSAVPLPPPPTVAVPLPPPPTVAVPLPPAATVAPKTTQPARVEPGMTAGQRNAVGSAESYLDFTSFSRQGLIDQLEYEDYSVEDATFAVDYVAPDWNAQAAESAQEYLDLTSFSRQGLIEQLEYSGFTSAQAEYGVDQAGL